MTSTRPRLSPEEQNAILGSVTTLLVHRLPGDWSQLFLDFRAAGTYVESPVSVLNIFGQSVDWPLPDEALPFFLELRSGMYREGEGTWLSARFHLAHPNVFSVEYNWSEEPAWTHRPAPEFYRQELEAHPRADVPAWLRGEPAGDAAPGLYEAPVFDGSDEQGRPIAPRPAVHPQDRDDVLAYLEQAPVVLAGRGFGPDLLAPDAEPDVPLTFHTDGTWVWSGAVPHYFRKHNVNPVPQLVQHVHDNGYAVPAVDEAALDAATKVASGGAESLALPEYRPRTIAEHDRQALAQLQERLTRFGVAPGEYGIVEPKLDALVIEPAPGTESGWQLQFWDSGRGPTGRPTVFPNAANAAKVMLGTLLWSPEQDAARAQHTTPPVAPPTAPARAPEIQPLPDEPPLSLLRDREPIVLNPGAEVDRFGDENGNLVFAARTLFGNRSLPPDWLNRRYHVYRAQRPVEAVKGIAVPWFGQAGGGTGFFLVRAVRDLLADGSLVEVAEATSTPPPPQT
ncbi:TNT domain-containing protein [Umezawaea sp. NPDC059074]|uniref:TNT domain-containing protein n=1 Tax=Umezawaea sp. NPDC059074 TaxID=3346716 RepID=UPI00369B5CE1